MRNWKSAALAFALVAVCAVAVAACGSGSGSSSGSSTTTTSGQLKGTLHVLEVTNISRATSALAKKFEQEHPGVTVKIENVPDTQIRDVERTRIASGDVPDVMHASPGDGLPSDIVYDAKAGVLMDLSDQPWAKRIPRAFVDVSSLNGKVYGLIASYQVIGTFYDKKVFAQLGLTPPTTYPQLLAMCSKIAAAGKIPIAVGAQDFSDIFLGYALVSSTAYAENPDFPQQRLANKVTFSGAKGWAESLAMYEQMNRAGCFGSSPTATLFVAAQQQTAVGKAVMLPSVLQSLGVLQQTNPRGDWAMFPLPGNSDPSLVRVPIGGSYGFSIPAKAKNPALAKAFLAFVAQPENDRVFAKAASILPVYGGAGSEVDTSALPAGLEAMRPFIQQGKTVTFIDESWPNPDVFTHYMQGLQAMLSGDGTTPAQIVKSMDAAWSGGK